MGGKGDRLATHFRTPPPEPLDDFPVQTERERWFGPGVGTDDVRARGVGAHCLVAEGVWFGGEGGER